MFIHQVIMERLLYARSWSRHRAARRWGGGGKVFGTGRNHPNAALRGARYVAFLTASGSRLSPACLIRKTEEGGAGEAEEEELRTSGAFAGRLSGRLDAPPAGLRGQQEGTVGVGTQFLV